MSLVKCRHAACGVLTLGIGVALPPQAASAQPPVTPQPRVLQPAARAGQLERPALARRPTLIKSFEVSREFGDRDVFDIVLGAPGLIRITASWQGTASSLAVILNGPGQTAFYARRDGASPLAVEFTVSAELFARGNTWRVSVVNFGGGRASGRVNVDYPASSPALATLSPALRAVLTTAIARPAAPPPAPERAILPDGRVQIRYPDGRTVIYEPGCGWTTVLPDGSVQKATCNQVQPATLPGVPSEPAVRVFLESHRDQLLQYISSLVENRQDEVDLYLGYEKKNAKGLFDQIRMRATLIDRLLMP